MIYSAFAACLLLLHRFLKCNERTKINYEKEVNSFANDIVLMRDYFTSAER